MNRIRKKKVERVRDLAEKASEIVLEALEILTEAKDEECDELMAIPDNLEESELYESIESAYNILDDNCAGLDNVNDFLYDICDELETIIDGG